MLLRRNLIILLAVIVAIQLCSGNDEERNDDCNKNRGRKRRDREQRRRERAQRKLANAERKGKNERKRLPGQGRRRSFISSPLRTSTTPPAPVSILPPINFVENTNGHHNNGHHHNAINGYNRYNGYTNGHNGNGYTNGHNGYENGYANGRPSYLCPSEFVRLGNACYYLSQHIATWQEAHFACRDMGSQLAGLETAWEDQTMRKYLNKDELARLERWIGGIFNWEQKRWIWGSSGKRMGYQGFSRRSAHEDRKWHCVLMDPIRLYRWTHRSCIEQRHYICEAPLHKQMPHKDKNEI